MTAQVHLPPGASLPNSTQKTLQNAAGDDFLIQVAWPLTWKSRAESASPIPIIYVLDGNAYFFSAVECVRRARMLTTSSDAIVVGVGYPPSDWVYDARRGYDLTPPAETYVAPRDSKGKEYPAKHGGATEFVEFIVSAVRKFVKEEVFPETKVSAEVLLGHSYGGLCTLHALFSGKTPFDTFVVLSPSIWWNDEFILSEEQSWHAKMEQTTTDQKSTSILFCYGEYEQNVFQRPDWSDEDYQLHLAMGAKRRMRDHAIEMANRFHQLNKLKSVKIKGYAEEDHGTVAICGISWAISSILDAARFK